MNTTQDILEEHFFFPTSIYKINKKEWLSDLSQIAEKAMNFSKSFEENNSNKLCNMSTNMLEDEKSFPFAEYILNSAKNILDSQGYDLSLYEVGISYMWMQEHNKYSDMAQHIHGNEGAGLTQLVGFYFIDINDNGCHLVLHDPRPAKVITNLQQKNKQEITHGSDMIFIKPEIGDLLFTNSYVPHSFSKNMSDEAVKFIHINIVVTPSRNACACPTSINATPEVI